MSLLCLPPMAAGQESYLDVDFDDGIPSSFIQIDNDRNEPSTDMKAIGFSAGTGWIGYMTAGDNNRVACSTSWYSPAGTSDDWLITPAFTVKSSVDVLRWRAMAHDKRHRDGYAVYVSAEGSASPSGFDTARPLFSIAEEEAGWTSRSVSLAAYEGKTIRVAFVNNSTDKSRLYIDDLFAGQPSSVYVSIGFPDVVDRAGAITVSGEAYTEEADPVEGFTVTFEYDGQRLEQHFDLTLTAGQRTAFTLSDPIVADNNSRHAYTATISHGDSGYTTTGILTVLAHKNLVEEGTGTWCGWCIRGIVAMANLAENHSDRFVGIAVHNEDVMADREYDKAVNTVLNPGGFPKTIFNRNPALTVDPLYMESFCRQVEQCTYPKTGLSLSAAYDEGSRMVDVATEVYFPVDADTMEYRLGYALIENDVHDASNDKYDQNNSYEGGGSGAMGGYENKPSPIPASDMYYQEVARGFFGDFNGIEGSVPSTVKAMHPNAFDYSFALPESVMKAENAEVVVMLIDKNNHVVNVDKVPLIADPDTRTTRTCPVSVRMERQDGQLLITADSPIRHIRLFSIEGRMLQDRKPTDTSVTLPTCGLHGTYLVRISTDTGDAIRKVLF